MTKDTAPAVGSANGYFARKCSLLLGDFPGFVALSSGMTNCNATGVFLNLYKILLPSVFVSLLLGITQVAAESISPQQAAELYRDNCAVCHGDRGDGQTRARSGLDPKPRDFTAAAAAQLSRQEMINAVVAGKPGTAMVAWHERLSKAEIDGVVDYIRSTFLPRPDEAISGGDGSGESDVQANEPVASKGKQIYEEHCRVCHGDRGNGSTWTTTVLNPSPRNFTAPQSRRILTRKRMIASVTHGRKETAMMSFSHRLTNDEIGFVVDYIRNTFMKGPVVADASMSDLAASSGRHSAGGHGAARGHAPAGLGASMVPRLPPPVEPAVDMTAPLPGALQGDFNNGRIIYLRSCVACHGPRGDGLGPRSHFINPKPRNFLHPESRRQLNRPELFKAIVIGKTGTVMPAWGKVLGPQQVADVAEFVFQDFIHPDPDSIEPLQGEPMMQETPQIKKKAH